ncbi:hypothetical protein VD0002_g42 [Verticillium dahliae]|uniref:Pfs protein n=2 Tax=Verticillium dahliae TaxID=27337 RepID=G2XH56_VERDV|nr:pfs protein [Verticillium dahliae VdLs.17]KAF3344610.1 Arylsulfatase K [Verticillium dahliae VDG2]KAH6688715.1 pfs protein [Verticillium dahliae]EGY19154.1 pfs protein [Verticillium dahliae VdLs.17]PNH28373.1 hypothetical protein BJF96_g8308 [Verticillium dahliae]PNH57534.1 hypothetical protein VD0003_g358 [Verticillium dahliae]
MSTAPRSRNDFEVAIVCALPLEFDAASILIDECWDEDGGRYGRAPGDQNHYVTGRVGNTNVVFLLQPRMGKAVAARAAEGLRFSYPRLRLVLLTGICGGAPTSTNGEEVVLGDVVISTNVIQYDLGTQNPDGFATRDKSEDALIPLPTDLQNMVDHLEAKGRPRLQNRVKTVLQELQKKALAQRRDSSYDHPGAQRDQLFRADYIHKHHLGSSCICANNQRGTDPICAASRKLACGLTGCDERFLVQRKRVVEKYQHEREGRQSEAQTPLVFIGRVASGDMVVRSGEARDRLVQRHQVVGFEMEGAGLWGNLPCLVVKGVCDYADSHKQKGWQNFAAATAASTAKALIEEYVAMSMYGVGPGTNKEVNKSMARYAMINNAGAFQRNGSSR